MSQNKITASVAMLNVLKTWGVDTIYGIPSGTLSSLMDALASGADLVALGRPAIYRLALGGSIGVQQIFEKLNDELQVVMQLAGTQTIDDVKNVTLRHNSYDPSVEYDVNELRLY